MINTQKIFIFLAVLILIGCSTSKNPLEREVKLLQKGKIKEDTSYVYGLPFEKGNSHFLIQGYYGIFTHKNRVALDFTMKRGTNIVAVREGVVLRSIENNSKGGLSKKYRNYANYIIIQHSDGTRAGYWHLKHNGVLVNIGDRVKAGQVIALSGKTGYAAIPHLHFFIWGYKEDRWQQIPTRFRTSTGIKYLKPFRKYKL